MFTSKTLILLCCIILNSSSMKEHQINNHVAIQVRGNFTSTLFKDLRENGFIPLYQITPSVNIFEYKGIVIKDRAIVQILRAFKDKIIAVEETRVYENSLKPVHSTQDKDDDALKVENLVCDKYYGMDVPKVWERNITGKGVVIAVNDVGINTDLLDLEQNVNKSICKNFLTDTSDVTPESFSELMDNPPAYSDHGNKVASIVASVKDNDICSAGIAYEATIVALKIYEVKLYNDSFFDISPSHWTASEIISRSFVYKLDEIDIFINAWGPTTPFDQLDIATRISLTYGATEGRQGLGVIYVVPAGPCGNELSHNIYTISVNSLGRFGSQPKDVIFDSSVLISGLRDGNNLTAASMVTASFNNTCVTTFRGVSAAVSQIAGIIALGLQTNPNLHLRDVQHLLVQAATHEHLAESIAFRSNGAFRHFHNIFGFGLLNADKFVSLAEKHEPVSSLISLSLTEFKRSTSGYHTQIFEFCYKCDVREDLSCLIFIEHVTTKVSFMTDDQHVKMEIISPSKTHSVLMDLKFDEDKTPVTETGNLVSVHFWDEMAFGKWTVKMQNKHFAGRIDVHNITLTLYGTRPAKKVDYAAIYSTRCNPDDLHSKESEVEIIIDNTATPKPPTTSPPLPGMITGVVVLLVVVVMLVISLVLLVIRLQNRSGGTQPPRS